jgi:hypothetical protein
VEHTTVDRNGPRMDCVLAVVPVRLVEVGECCVRVGQTRLLSYVSVLPSQYHSGVTSSSTFSVLLQASTQVLVSSAQVNAHNAIALDAVSGQAPVEWRIAEVGVAPL